MKHGWAGRWGWMGIGCAVALLSGCFSEEGYGNETVLLLPEADDTGSGAPGDGPMGPGGPGAGAAGTMVPGDTSTGMPGMPGGAGPVDMPMAGSGGEMTPDGGMEMPMPMVPAMCDGEIECVGGKAGEYGCSGVNLLSHLEGPEMQGGTGNDIWGWQDPMTGKEYVLMGLTNGTAFVDISDPCNPVHLGHLRTETVEATWRDIKVYKDRAYIVSESVFHGMQVFDLTQLRNVMSPPVAFKANYVLQSFGAAHNVALNPESGFAFAVTTNNCASARSIDLSNPDMPVDRGCWGTGNRIHDAQCVTYKGPDAAYAGKEICFTGDEGRGVGIYDVTDKSNVKQIGGVRYQGAEYGHQGWLTEDHKYFVFGDEGDEVKFGNNTTTFIIDVSSLTMPKEAGKFVNTTASTDHNLYVKGNYAFQASYTAGMRILDLSGIASGTLSQKAYFDTFPESDINGYMATWGVYPFLPSGIVITSGSEGLFVLRPQHGLLQ